MENDTPGAIEEQQGSDRQRRDGATGRSGIIIAGFGRQAGVITDVPNATIIAMSLPTSVVAPHVLTALFGRTAESNPAVDRAGGKGGQGRG